MCKVTDLELKSDIFGCFGIPFPPVEYSKPPLYATIQTQVYLYLYGHISNYDLDRWAFDHKVQTEVLLEIALFKKRI